MDKIIYDKEIRSFALVATPLNKTSVSSKLNKTAKGLKSFKQSQGKLKFMVLARDLMTKKPIKKMVTTGNEMDAVTKFRKSYMGPGIKIKPIMIRAFKIPDENNQAMKYAQLLSK